MGALRVNSVDFPLHAVLRDEGTDEKLHAKTHNISATFPMLT